MGLAERVQVARPPLATQREIAAILGQVQKAIEEQERLLALTAELKRTLLHRLFTQGLHGEPQMQTDIGPVPESWEVMSLHEVCKIISGGTPSKQRADFWQGTIPWVSAKDMKAIIPCKRVVSGFLLYAMTAFKHRLMQKLGRSAHGTATLMSSEIADFPIPLPDAETQRAVATILDEAEHRYQTHQRKHAALSDLFRTLLHQLMTGHDSCC